MFQLASTSTVGYRASHALVCGTLCHIMAREFSLPEHERNALVRAALTSLDYRYPKTADRTGA